MAMRKSMVALTGVVMLAAGALVWAQGNADDVKALDAVAKAWQKAFNDHNAKALADVYTQDADFLMNTGEWLKGRAAIEKEFAGILERNPKATTKLKVTSHKFIKSDVV